MDLTFLNGPDPLWSMKGPALLPSLSDLKDDEKLAKFCGGLGACEGATVTHPPAFPLYPPMR